MRPFIGVFVLSQETSQEGLLAASVIICFVFEGRQWVTVPVASAKLVLIESFHALLKFWRIPFEAGSIVMQLLEE